MPRLNPKHLKKPTVISAMGSKHSSDKCVVKNCSDEATHHLAIANIEGYLGQLNWELNVEPGKGARGALCKKHYKDYKKLKDKDEKWTTYRTFEAQKPTREKTHSFLE